MARGKKFTSSKMIILPKEKHPFSVPGNWFWSDIDSINQYSGFSIDPMKQPDTTFELYSVPSSAVDYPEIITGSKIGSAKQSVMKNDILLCKINPRINRVWKVFQHTDNELVASSEWIIIRNTTMNPDYLMFCFRTQYFREFMLSNVSGVGGSLMRAQPKFVKNYPIPIPPLAEQKRIVDRIERLFIKLDEAREKAQAVVDGFELRKSAILHKAFTGELTERWRKEHAIKLDTWRQYTVGDVCKEVKVGIVIKPSQYYTDKNEGIPAFRSANVRECSIDDFDWVYLNEKGMADNKRSIVHTGDVLVVRSGNPGIACVVSEEFDGYNAIDILIAVPNQDMVLSGFLCLFTNSPLGKKFVAESKRGMALTHFNVKEYSKVEINIPLVSEQKAIICMLDKFIEKEQQAKQSAESILTQIDTMKKAILSRAFRGELGTNEPAEESAVELLKTVL